MWLAAAKSMYLLAFSVVAPWRSLITQLSTPKCMPHQIPTYFIGRIQSVVSNTHGSFRFRINPELISPTAFGAICMVLQGVWKVPPVIRAFTPSGQGASSDFSRQLPVFFKVISGKSVSAASCILAYIFPVLNVMGVLALSIWLMGCVRYSSS